MIEPHTPDVFIAPPLVARCEFCRWTATFQAVPSPDETIIRDTLEAVAFLRDRLIEHCVTAHPDRFQGGDLPPAVQRGVE